MKTAPIIFGIVIGLFFIISFANAVDFAEVVAPNIVVTSSSSAVSGDISLIKDNNLSTFYGIGESQHHGGSASMNLTYVFSTPVNLENISFSRDLRTGGSSSDTERQIEKVIVWDNSGGRVVYNRSVVYGGSSGTAAGGLLEDRTIDGPFNEITKVEFNFYVSSSGGSSDRLTRIRLYEVGIEGQPIEPECDKDSDCGNVGVGKICDANDSVVTTTTPKCNSGKCEVETDVRRGACAYGCAAGECNPAPVINCSSSSQCGNNGYVGNKYCDANDSYQDYMTFTCNNAGTSSSSCSNNVVKTKKDDCAYGCVGGVCSNPPQPNCCSNSQCGTNLFLGQLFCKSGDVYDKFLSFTCNNPGTVSSSCSNSTSDVKIVTCVNGCSNGLCLNPVINCSSSFQCGINGYVGNKYCDANDSYQDYRTFTCNNAGTVGSYCSNTTVKTRIEDCANGCSNGLCLNPVINCSSSSQCGVNHYLNQLFCSNDDVYDKFLSFTCNNAGTASSFCSDSISSVRVEDCGYGYSCENGACEKEEKKDKKDTPTDVCGDLICDAFRGETSLSCPRDCDDSFPESLVQQLEIVTLGNISAMVLAGDDSDDGASVNWLIFLIVMIILIVLLALLIIRML